MSATLLCRIATVVYVLFTFGHAYGFLSFRPLSSEGRARRLATTCLTLLGSGS